MLPSSLDLMEVSKRKKDKEGERWRKGRGRGKRDVGV